MVKKVGKLKNLKDLANIDLEEEESVVVDGIEDVKIIIGKFRSEIYFMNKAFLQFAHER
jgi:hypothetical protein